MPEFDAAMARLKHKRPRKELTPDEEARLTEAVNDFIIKMEAAAELGNGKRNSMSLRARLTYF